MGKIEFANCQDVRNQKKIQELDCPRCHEPGGIEAFVKDGILAEDGVCDNCGYILPEGTELEWDTDGDGVLDGKIGRAHV